MTGVAFFDIDSFQLEEGVVATEYERPAPAPDYPIEIHSLNDFDVISQTNKYRNIAKNRIETIFGSGSKWVQHQNSNVVKNNPVEIKGMENWNLRHIKADIDTMIYLHGGENNGEGVRGGQYTLAVYVKNIGNTSMYFGYNGQDSTTVRKINLENGSVSSSSTVSSGEEVLMLVDFTHRTAHAFWQYSIRSSSSQIEIIMSDVMIFEGRVGQDIVNSGGLFGSPLNPEEITSEEVWTGIDKINILLDEPLRSVGNVKDRLYRDADGLWKIERNVGEYTTDGTDAWSQGASSGGWNVSGSTSPFYSSTLLNKMKPARTINAMTDRFTVGKSTVGIVRSDSEGFSLGYASWGVIFRIEKSRLSTDNSEGFKEWIGNNPVTIVYELANPSIETLPQSLQDKLNNLRSFQDSNYVYTIINNKTDIISENLKPTLHAIFKSSGWYNRWKTEDELRKHQSAIDEKADNKSTEESINNAIANIQVLQQELEAAATANELDDFIDKYNKDMESRAKDERASEENLSTALSSISMIEKDMGEMSETWKFIDRFIQNTPKGIVVGNESTGSYILIKEDRLSFFSNSQEVAFISQNLMEISRGAFVEQIQIAKYQFEESTNNHLTIRYVG